MQNFIWICLKYQSRILSQRKSAVVKSKWIKSNSFLMNDVKFFLEKKPIYIYFNLTPYKKNISLSLENYQRSFTYKNISCVIYVLFYLIIIIIYIYT